MENSKLRSSNFELLRIFSMLIIIIHHYSQCTSKISFPGTCEPLEDNVGVAGNKLAC